MTGYILSPEAEDDVFDIWSHVAKEIHPELAERVEPKFFEGFMLLARNPGLGHKREDLTPEHVFFYRIFPYQYLVIYRQRTSLEIVAVLHANVICRRF